MSIKIHFLNRHLANFLENLGAVGDDQDERFEGHGGTVSGSMGGIYDGELLLEASDKIVQRLNTLVKAISVNLFDTPIPENL
ncbi:hypothetical protein ILUMI_06470, partial [Ignelater luminosus]